MSGDKTLQINLEGIPNCPGAYLMKDAQNKVIYVGKANNLRSRVRSHFAHPASRFASEVEKVEYIAAENSGEALLLEYNLIKKYHPAYNIRLRDDKRYPYIKLTMNETYPRAYLTRTLVEDGAYYFGPYPDVRGARKVLKAVKEIFPYRSCRYQSKQFPLPRPCIDYEMKRCVGPCIDAVTVEEYQNLCREVARFLRGRQDEVRKRVQTQMDWASRMELFEKAATYRDILKAMDTLSERQIISTLDRSGGFEDQNEDYLGLARCGDITAMVVLKKRSGSIVASEYYFLDGAAQESEDGAKDESVFEAFLFQYYDKVSDYPRKVHLPLNLKMQQEVEDFLEKKASWRVALVRPQRGTRHQTLEMAQQNATLRAKEQFKRIHGVKGTVEPAVEQLQRLLNMAKPPLRIEGYDISNISGTDAVGSMVVLQGGRPYRSGYRKFRMRDVEGIDDYAMMREMLSRRLSRRDDEGFGTMPDLVLIDGGAGHLAAAAEVFEQNNCRDITLISLAKQEEEIYTLNGAEPIRLPQRSPVLKMLQLLRDEAHRFAITYHRSLRSRKLSHSVLEEIEGLGINRKQALIRRFGSVEAIRAASVEEIDSVPGISPKLAEKIKKQLTEEQAPADSKKNPLA